MKPAAFEFHTARTIEEATELLAELGDDSKVLAGGQSLGPMLNYRMIRPSHLIDIRSVAELQDIDTAGDKIWIGAAISHASIEDRKTIDGTGDALPRIAHRIAYRAIRNRGTIGGSIAHADPSADWPVVMSALGAEIEICSTRRKRIVPVRDFFVDQMETVLEADEIIVGIRLQKFPFKARFGYAKIVRKVGEFANSIAAALVTSEADGAVARASIWLGAATGIPTRLDGVETVLLGQRWTDSLRASVAEAVREALPAAENDLGRHKIQLHAVCVGRALDDAFRAAPA